LKTIANVIANAKANAIEMWSNHSCTFEIPMDFHSSSLMAGEWPEIVMRKSGNFKRIIWPS
jgi:hypothetical protein